VSGGASVAIQRQKKTSREERMGLRLFGAMLIAAAALAMNGGASAQS